MELKPKSLHISEAHNNAIYEYVYVLNGELNIEVDGITHIVKEKQMLKFNANLAHIYTNQSEALMKSHIIIAIR